MKKNHIRGLFLAMVLFSSSVRADLFGGDVAVLTQILHQAVMQLTELREILGSAKENVELVREIHRGINDSLHLLRTIDPNIDPGIYREWATVDEALRSVEDIYGRVPVSIEGRVQRDIDRNAAEAIAANNSFYKSSVSSDQIADRISDYSHQVSPGGAAKLTAQALGFVIKSLNQNLRAQSTGIKLQAQQLAVENHQQKEATRLNQETTKSLSQTMRKKEIRFDIPRF